VRERGGRVPHRTLARRLDERAREARRPSGGEVGDRVEAERTEAVGHGQLPEPIGAGPRQRLEAVAAPARLPDGLVRALGGPAALVALHGAAAQREAGNVARRRC